MVGLLGCIIVEHFFVRWEDPVHCSSNLESAFHYMWTNKNYRIMILYFNFLQSSWLFSYFFVIRMPRNDNYSAITQCKYLYVYLTVCHVGNLSVRLSLSFVWYVSPSFRLSLLPDKCGCVFVCLYLSVHPYVRTPARPSVHPSIHPSSMTSS